MANFRYNVRALRRMYEHTYREQKVFLLLNFSLCGALPSIHIGTLEIVRTTAYTMSPF